MQVEAPRAFTYIRCSHVKQLQDDGSGYGLEFQESQCRRYYEGLRDMRIPELEWGGCLVDKAVSASKIPLIARPEGKRLHEMLRPGDHVIFLRLDRAFRFVPDMYETFKLWDERGISMHFVQEGMDLSTANGRMIAGTLAVFAQWWCEFISERTREGLAIKKMQNEDINGKIPIGHKFVTVKRRGKYVKVSVPDHEKQLHMRWLRWAYRCGGYSMRRLFPRLNELLVNREIKRAAREGNDPRPLFEYQYPNRHVTWRMCQRALQELYDAHPGLHPDFDS